MTEKQLIEEFEKIGFHNSKGTLKFSRARESISYMDGMLVIFLKKVSEKELFLIKELAKLKELNYEQGSINWQNHKRRRA